MSWTSGTRVNHYELIHALGAGGMGEVWLANDSRLGRQVAIKLLPIGLTSDRSRTRRFEQEARSASGLNHPNVCTIHAFEHAGDGQHFIVMEHVDGETLRSRLMRGRPSLHEVLDIGTQIASALSAAHAAGVVHRDVKPENIMLRPDGLVKVLDFGLAKLASNDSDPRVATQTANLTTSGSVLGTAAYMSPEQARGLPVDARTDAWSLGVVAYEMVAGRQPFGGQTTSDVIAAILEREYEPLPRLAPEVPSELVRIVGKSLRKDPGQRYQVMKDLQLDLEALRDETATRATAGSRNDVPAPEPASRPRRAAMLAAFAALVLAVGATAWWYRQRASPAPPPSGASATPVARPLTRLTFDEGLQTDATFSPDGRSIAYASDRAGNFDIWVQALDGSQPRQLTNSPAPETQPAWSPDGKTIVFRSDRDRGGLFLTNAHGGPERQLSSFGVNPVWSPDGSEILFSSGFAESFTGLHAVAADAGSPPRVLLGELMRGGAWHWFAPHPDGRISVYGLDAKSGFGFYTASRDGKRVTASKFDKALPFQWTEQGVRLRRFQWNRAGTALFVEVVLHEVQNVWRVRVDPATLDWVAAERLTTGSGPDESAAVSPDGERMLFTVQRQSTRLWTFPLDAAAGRITGQGTPITPEDGRAENSALSPDGRFAAVTMKRTGTARVELLLVDIDSNKSEVFAVDAISPAWSPDSRTLAYVLSRPDRPPPGEFALAARRVGGPERILRPWSGESVVLPTGWTPDGQSVLGLYLAPLHVGRSKLVFWPMSPAVPQTERTALEDPGHFVWQGNVSPNGRWLAFDAQRSDEIAQSGIYVARSGAPLSEWVRMAPDHKGADKPRWAPGGRMLYFLSNHGSSFWNLWGLRFDPDRGAAVGAPFVLTTFNSPDLVIPTALPDLELGISARRALLTLATIKGNIWMLENVDR